MSYTSRNRYTNRREKYAKSMRKLRIIVIFVSIALLVLVFKNRVAIYDWFRLLFY